MEVSQHFQQLAMVMIQTTKALQNHAHGRDTGMSDKDLETKLKMLKEILEFKFKIPLNIYQSILETIITILVSRVDISKDFLVLGLLNVL
jgi:hypothetical protein